MNSDKKKLLFLDIDGVVNTLMIYSEQDITKHLKQVGEFYFDLCSPSHNRVSNIFAIRWLNKLCLEYDLSLVITSTWMIGHSLSYIESCLRNSGLDPRVNVLDGITKRDATYRGEQIEQWCIDNGIVPEDNLIVILDDDSDMSGKKIDFSKYLVKCDTYHGFGLPEYTKACDVLLTQIVYFVDSLCSNT
jgi:hypothetical protein